MTSQLKQRVGRGSGCCGGQVSRGRCSRMNSRREWMDEWGTRLSPRGGYKDSSSGFRVCSWPVKEKGQVGLEVIAAYLGVPERERERERQPWIRVPPLHCSLLAVLLCGVKGDIPHHLGVLLMLDLGNQRCSPPRRAHQSGSQNSQQVVVHHDAGWAPHPRATARLGVSWVKVRIQSPNPRSCSLRSCEAFWSLPCSLRNRGGVWRLISCLCLLKAVD